MALLTRVGQGFEWDFSVTSTFTMHTSSIGHFVTRNIVTQRDYCTLIRVKRRRARSVALLQQPSRQRVGARDVALVVLAVLPYVDASMGSLGRQKGGEFSGRDRQQGSTRTS